VNCDDIQTLSLELFTNRVTSLSREKMTAVAVAVHFALALEE